MIAAVVIDDGRPAYLEQAVASLHANLNLKPDDPLIMINDSGDSEYAEALEELYPDFTQFVHHETRRGLAGAVRSAWETALSYSVDYVWHQEDDFVINERIDLLQLNYLLEENPRLAQIALKRQPVNPEEIQAGDFMRLDPDVYWDHGEFTEHRHLFTFNPCLIPRHCIEYVLANTSNTLEREVTDVLLDAGRSFGFLGGIADEPRTTHIGWQRTDAWSV